jgi:hypothetical protein
VNAAPLPAEEAAAVKTDAVPSYELKNRSSFIETDPDARAPFWPIGWVKRAAGPAVPVVAPAPKILLNEKSFKVTSILLGAGATPSLAVINGRAYSEGEFLRVPKGSGAPRIRVQRINDGNVILQHAEQTLVALLQRPELMSRKTEELLLDPDR